MRDCQWPTMTIEEAIRHAEEVAENCDGECSDEHRQLAEWLKELKQWQKLAEGIDLRPESLMKPFQPNVNDLERENDRLKAENDELKAKVLWLEVTLIEMAYERYDGGDLIEHIKAKIAGKTG